MTFPFDQYSLESPLKKMSDTTMAPVERLCVCFVEPLHPPGDPRLRSLHQKMEVIVHEYIGVQNPSSRKDHGPQQVEKCSPVAIVTKNLAAFISAARDVPDRSCKIETQLSRQLWRGESLEVKRGR